VARPISSRRWKCRNRVDSDGAHPVEARRIRITWAAVRPGFSRFNAAASSNTCASIRVPACRIDGDNASNPPAR
jgi:hypothetical protein